MVDMNENEARFNRQQTQRQFEQECDKKETTGERTSNIIVVIMTLPCSPLQTDRFGAVLTGPSLLLLHFSAPQPQRSHRRQSTPAGPAEVRFVAQCSRCGVGRRARGILPIFGWLRRRTRGRHRGVASVTRVRGRV